MKSSQKARLEKLERMFNAKSTKRRVARVVYDASAGYDLSALNVDAEIVLFLPDNGMQTTDKMDLSMLSCQIFYDK